MTLSIMTFGIMTFNTKTFSTRTYYFKIAIKIIVTLWLLSLG
jgi:hypothetical protein